MFSLSEDEGLSEKHVIAFDFERSKAPRFQRCCTGFEGAIGKGFRSIDGQVAEVFGVPQDNARGDAIVHVALVLVGQAKADDFHVLPTALLDGFGSSGNRRRADGHEDLDVGIRVENGGRLAECLVLQSRHKDAGRPA